MAKSNFTEKPSAAALNRARMSVVFAVDVSGSMDGKPIRNVEENLNRFAPFVCEDEQTAKCVEMAVVTFGDEVRVLQNWVPVTEMPRVSLGCEGLTDLNGGVQRAAEMLREHSRVYSEKGLIEKKPYLVVLSDGADTVAGNVDAAASYVVPRERDGKLKVFFLGVDDYDRAAAAQLTEGSGSMVFEIHDGSYDFSEFFKFVAESAKAASKSAPGEKLKVETNIGREDCTTKAVVLDDWVNR